MKSVILIAILVGSSPSPEIDCRSLQQATFAEGACQASGAMMAADGNHGVYTAEMSRIVEQCESDARSHLIIERSNFIRAHKKLIKALRPGFSMQKATDEEWVDLMYAKPAMCAAVTPAQSAGNSN